MYRCPECQSDHLSVEVRAFVTLHQDNGCTQFDANQAEPDWDSRSIMACNHCQHSAPANTFYQGNDEEK